MRLFLIIDTRQRFYGGESRTEPETFYVLDICDLWNEIFIKIERVSSHVILVYGIVFLYSFLTPPQRTYTIGLMSYIKLPLGGNESL